MAAATQINTDSITTLPQGIQCIEQNYIDRVVQYLKTKKDLGFTNINYTMSYS